MQHTSAVETAEHLADHVFPRLPVRQRVLSVPKRLRYLMQLDGAVSNMVLRIFRSAATHLKFIEKYQPQEGGEHDWETAVLLKKGAVSTISTG